jgi:hypothetical protein
MTQISPLATDSLPEPADLGAYWLQVEEAVRSLHPTIQDLTQLNHRHLRHLAPVLLGAKGWQQYQHETFYDWAHFKRVISADFGLSGSQLTARFYALEPEADETSASFVLRVE